VKIREWIAWCSSIALASAAALGWRAYGQEHKERLRERTREAQQRRMLEQQRLVQEQLGGALPHRDKPQIDDTP
jgi:hypothetical protein